MQSIGVNGLVFYSIWNYFLGYLVIRVEGLSLEKFINLCVSREIKLWGIKRIGYTSLYANIGIKDFKSLPPIVRVVGSKVKIIDKKGFPFVAYRFKHRKMLIVGMAIFLVSLYVLSSFVWTVEVEGTVMVNPEIIYNLLEEKGVSPGAYKGDLNLWNIENELLIEIPELSWISIELKGTKAIARVVEAVKPPKLIDSQLPCNIIAAKDGIIHQLIVLEGEAVVEVEDTVREGQLLVSGIIEHEDTQLVRYVHARANAYARVWYEGKGQGDFDRVAKIRTGKKITHKLLETRGWEIDLNNKKIPFKEYEIEEKKELVPGIGKYTGLCTVTRDYYEVETSSPSHRNELAKAKALENAMEDALKNIPKAAKIIDKTINYDIIKDKGYEAVVYVEVLEDIAQQVELSVN